MITNFKEAIVMRVKTPEDIETEMENPNAANFAMFDYTFPNGIRCGIGKSRRPGHAAMFQLVVTDFDGKSNIKFPVKYSGEYTSSTRAEKDLRQYCKEAWDMAELAKTKATRRAETEKDEELPVVYNKDGKVMFDPNEVISDELAAETLLSATG